MPFTRGNKTGFVLAILLALADIPSLLNPTPEGSIGPPLVVLMLTTACGAVTLVAVAIGWSRRRRLWIRVAAGSRVVSALAALPALLVEGVPPQLRVLVAAFVLLSVLSVVLMLAPGRGARSPLRSDR
ncbi:MAG: hypothetical protein Q4P07_14090 [Ornithinimicrobium sp.]|uniref:hypothetical protein n=1 Tax=Ornithinimicrobium sp. TaxID=1977084 RepID=UPI0026E0633F|nr:hypothetical protein [Ornithinimicrobium sp.]MDO5741267.1 hypothetical protein [Ornithinimicrobium sp.]